MAFASDGARVLVVDDDAEVRDALGMLLSSEGFGVEYAADGVDALACFDRREPFQALVCDLDMPRLGGVALVRAARKRTRGLVVVIVSGRFDLLASTANLGQVYAMAKPCDADRLINILRQALEERS